MITRPLDLAAKMRSDPRSFDWLFFVNGGLIVLFFFLFGSRFVLAPGLALEPRLAEIAGANATARMTTEVISVLSSGQILTRDGTRKLEELTAWLVKQRGNEREPTLLVHAGGAGAIARLVEISNAAQLAGYKVLLAAEDVRPTERAGGR